MTFTILGHCARTGQVGVGITSYSLVVGALCPAVDGDAGVVSSQAFVNPELRGLGLNLLRQGHPAAQALQLAHAADPLIEFRQLLVLDRNGRGAGFTGSRTRPWAGHKVGPGYVVAGNVLVGEPVIEAMAAAFAAAPDADLDARLLAAVEAGRDAGGQAGASGHLPERSAALMVRGRASSDELDLRVDCHPEAVAQLRALREEWAPHRAFHHLRHVDPASAPPQEQFIAGLAQRRGSR